MTVGCTVFYFGVAAALIIGLIGCAVVMRGGRGE